MHIAGVQGGTGCLCWGSPSFPVQFSLLGTHLSVGFVNLVGIPIVLSLHANFLSVDIKFVG